MLTREVHGADQTSYASVPGSPARHTEETLNLEAGRSSVWSRSVRAALRAQKVSAVKRRAKASGVRGEAMMFGVDFVLASAGGRRRLTSDHSTPMCSF